MAGKRLFDSLNRTTWELEELLLGHGQLGNLLKKSGQQLFDKLKEHYSEHRANASLNPDSL